MSALLDTNVLLVLAQPESPLNPVAAKAVFRLAEQGIAISLVSQVIYEFWVVCTRPREVNGLGLSPQETFPMIVDFRSHYPLLLDPPWVYTEWESRVTRHQVAGKQAHDARLVAAMAVHGLTRLLTFNPRHFARYPEIETIDPSTV